MLSKPDEFNLRDKVRFSNGEAEIIGEVWQKSYDTPIRYGVRADFQDYKDVLAEQMEAA